MAPVPGTGVVWVGGLQSAPDANGVERMFAYYARLAGLGTLLEHGFSVWDPNSETLQKVSSLPLDETRHARGAAPFVHVDGGTEYLYFPDPYPDLRVERKLAYLDQPQRFQGYTPLVAGTRFAGANTQLERDPLGRLVWDWKGDTPPLTPAQQRELVDGGMMTLQESPFRLRDHDTGLKLIEHNGTVAWNAYRQKWVMILGVSFAEESFLGEIYYAESAALEGPWARARKIITHDDYTFYNVAHRSFMDQDGGRLIHFEGTYTRTFSGTEVGTPRYEYNQIMYRLDLADPRLTQP